MSERNKKQCIVLLPSGPHYDRLFDEILEPVLAEYGLNSRQLLRNRPSPIPVDVFIDEIEQSDVLFADVSENTPQIWLAAGCALALGRPLCLISSSLDTTPLLGLQYLPLIPYPPNAFPNDYLQLQQHIAAHLSAITSTTAVAQPELYEPSSSSAPAAPIPDDLASYEMMALSILDLKSTDAGLSPRDLGMEMQIRDSAHLTSHAMNALKRRQFIERRPVQLSYGNEVRFSENLFLTRAGKDWLMRQNRRATTHRSTTRTRDFILNR